MRLYPLFLLVAATTVASPGPGVVLTLTNAVRYGRWGTLGGILGLVFGALLIATISATGLGVILATSAAAFTVTKLLGAAYLFYLGVRMWRAPVFRFEDAAPETGGGAARRFVEAVTIQLTNPKAIFFFLSVFPQFIDRSLDFGRQFAVLVVTYGTLILLIHSVYALCARQARAWLSSPRGGRALNRLGGTTFMVFGAALATAKR
jgi:homoserine/homoserine lactone efflux protein